MPSEVGAAPDPGVLLVGDSEADLDDRLPAHLFSLPARLYVMMIA